MVHQNVVGKGIRERVKQFVADNWSHLNIGCSAYIAQHYKRSLPIPNGYNEKEFHTDKSWANRPHDLLYVGRLVSDKGCDTLLRGLAILRDKGLIYKLNMIGKGEEEPKLQALTKELGLENQVTFWGQLPREELNVIMNDHKILIVPSRYEEPFGTFRVACTKGTYVRSLVHDLGQRLGCGAHLRNLRRVDSGKFSEIGRAHV